MSQATKANIHPTNAWACEMSDTEWNYAQEAKAMTDEEFYDILGIAEMGFTSPLFYDVMIEEMYKRRLQNLAASKASLECIE